MKYEVGQRIKVISPGEEGIPESGRFGVVERIGDNFIAYRDEKSRIFHVSRSNIVPFEQMTVKKYFKTLPKLVL